MGKKESISVYESLRVWESLNILHGYLQFSLSLDFCETHEISRPGVTNFWKPTYLKTSSYSTGPVTSIQKVYTKTSKVGMLIGWFHVTKNLQKAFVPL